MRAIARDDLLRYQTKVNSHVPCIKVVVKRNLMKKTLSLFLTENNTFGGKKTKSLLTNVPLARVLPNDHVSDSPSVTGATSALEQS